MNRLTATTLDRLLIGAIVFPVVALIVLTALSAVSWQRHAKQIRPALQNSLPAKLVDSEAPLAEVYRERTSTDQTHQLRRIFSAADLADQQYGPLFDLLDLEERQRWFLEDDIDPRIMDAVNDCLSEYQGALSAFEEVDLNGKPVWLPVREGKFSYSFQLSRVRRLIQLSKLRFQAAVANRQPEEAAKAFVSTDRAYQFWTLGTARYGGRDLVPLRERIEFQRRLAASMQSDKWSEESLNTLLQTLKTSGPSRRIWDETVSARRLMRVPELIDGEIRLDDLSGHLSMTIAPSDRLAEIQWYERMKNVTYIGTSHGMREVYDLVHAPIESDRIQTRRSWDTLIQFPASISARETNRDRQHYYQLALRLLQSENARRFALAAVAIRAYADAKEQLPDSLRDLDAVGVSAETLVDGSGQPFVFRREGDRCFLGNASVNRLGDVLGTPVAWDGRSRLQPFHFLEEYQVVVISE
jgi:hypothetical protein